MRLAIMQPYLFPYLGYYQLLDQSEVFVIYDDVQYTRRGWINRNRLWVNDGEYTFTLPVKKAQRDTPIHAIELCNYSDWRSQFLKTLQMAYGKADYFSWTYDIIKKILNEERNFLIDLLCYSIEIIKDALGINTPILPSSRIFQNEHLDGVDRIVDICKRLHACEYLNLPGGRVLYDPDVFDSSDIELEFLLPETFLMLGPKLDHEANLSIIDLMMWQGRAGVRQMMRRYSLVKAHIESNLSLLEDLSSSARHIY